MASPKQARSGLKAALKSTSVAVAIAALTACGGGGGGGDTSAAAGSTGGNGQSVPSAGSPLATGTPTASGSPTGTGPSATGSGSTAPASGTGTSTAGAGSGATASGGAATPVVFQQADFQVNTLTAGSQGGANVARLADGGYVVVWDSITADGSGSVHLQRFGADGQLAGAEQVVAANGNASQVTAFADGRFLVTWKFSPYAYDVDGHAQMFDAQGAPVGAPMVLGSGFNGYQPRPMALRDGTFIAAIDVQDSKYGPLYGLVQHFGADGSPLGQAARLDSQLSAQTGAYSPNSAGQARTALLADGRIAAVWLARGTGISELRLTLFDGQVARLADRTLVSGAAPMFALPAIAALPGGGAAIAWVSGSYDQPKAAYLATLDSTGAMGTPQVLATADANVDLPAVQLATLSDGNLVATWSIATNDGVSKRQRQLFAQRFTASGAPVGAASTIDTATSDSAVDTLPPLDSLAVTATTGSGFLALYGRWTAQDSWDVRATVR